MKRSITNNVTVFYIIVLCFISRLPQLCSPYFMMDGDECIEGLMAKHLYEGKDAALYFYGQNYGLSIIETSIIAGGISLFGISDYTVKLTMLLLWTIGVVFFYKTLKSLDEKDTYLPILVTLLLIMSPAWAVWSMKARGGYLSAFTLSNTILYLLFSKATTGRYLTWVCIGALVFLVYKCQPLWIPPLLPLLAYTVLTGNAILKKTLLSVSGVILTIILFYFLPNNDGTFWQPQVFDLYEFYPRHLIGFIYSVNHGFYYLTDIYNPPFTARLFSVCVTCLVAVLISFAGYYCIKSFRKEKLFIVSVCSMMLILAYILFIDKLIPRYALPLLATILLSLYLLLHKLSLKTAYIFCLLLIIPGVASIIQFKEYAFVPVERKAMVSTVSYLEKKHLNYIFSSQGLLQWQLMFYSNERLHARFIYNTDRYPLYVNNVNTAYNNDSSKTAIVGFSQDFNSGLEKASVKNLGNGFSIYPAPSSEVLKMREYEF